MGAPKSHPVSVATQGKRHETGVTARADYLAELHAELQRAYEARDGSPATDQAWARAAAEFNEACRLFYEPYEGILAVVRNGQTDAIEGAVRFLLADPWCHRIGYLKADLMHALANTALPPQVVGAVRDVVVRRTTNRQVPLSAG